MATSSTSENPVRVSKRIDIRADGKRNSTFAIYDECYQALVGETFSGTYDGEFQLKNSLKTWTKIKIDDRGMSETMADRLEEITSYGGIWKGYHKGTLYIDSNNFETAKNFQIVGFEHFEMHNNNNNSYTRKRGYYFRIKPFG